MALTVKRFRLRAEEQAKACTLNPEPGTRNPERGTRNPELGTRNSEPEL